MQGPKRRQVIVATALACAFGSAQAQTFPARPVRIVVPQPAGGRFDTVGLG